MKNHCGNIEHDFDCRCEMPKKKILIIGGARSGKKALQEAMKHGFTDVELMDLKNENRSINYSVSETKHLIESIIKDAQNAKDMPELIVQDNQLRPISQRTINRQNKPKKNKYGQIKKRKF